jgi:hypothetical protein
MYECFYLGWFSLKRKVKVQVVLTACFHLIERKELNYCLTDWQQEYVVDKILKCVSVRTELTVTERSIGKFDGRVINFHVNFSLPV